jgi:Ser/Thr protein kinase RdoA (MazF antagonist)
VTLFETFRDFARKDLDRLAEGLDYGLIHADLVRENVLVDGQAAADDRFR